MALPNRRIYRPVGCLIATVANKKKTFMSCTSLEVVDTLQNNMMNRDVVRGLIARDAAYVSPNTKDAELFTVDDRNAL
jgi:hypothetical protein